MKNMKKIAALLLSCSLLAASFTACSKGGTPAVPSSEGGEAAQSGAKTDAPKEVRTITLLGSDSGNKNWENREKHDSYKALQKMLADNSLQIEAEIVAQEQYKQILQTRLASATSLPDMINTGELDTASLINIGQKGVLLDAKALVKEKSNGNVESFSAKYFPDMWKSITTSDGKAYWMPLQQNISYLGKPFYSNLTPLVRKDWVDKAGIQMPDTLAEFETMLKIFQDKDMNGNGKKDEKMIFPMTFNYIAPSFGLPADYVIIDPYDHKAKSPWLMKDELIEFVTYISGLVNQDLIDKDTIGPANEIKIQKTQSNQISALMSYAVGTAEDANVKAYGGTYQPVMLGKTEGVIPRTYAESDYVAFGRFSISSKCQDPSAIIDLIDMSFTEEYANLFFYGIENVSHTVENGVKIFHPDFKTKEFYEIQGTGSQVWIGTGMPGNQISTWESYMKGLKATRPDLEAFSDKYCVGQEYWFTGGYGLGLPTTEETERLLKIENDIKTYSTETITKLCLGTEPISSIDKHIETLKELGLEEIVSIYQARHDRFMAA